MVILIVEFIM